MSFDPETLIPLGESMARAALPTLSTILSAAVPFPFSMFVGPAFAAIAAALGQDPTTATPATVQAAITADPVGAATKLQPVEDHFKVQADAAQAELAARLADVQDARSTQMRLVQSGSWLANANVILAAVVIVGFFAVTLAVITHAVDSSQTTIYLITVLGTGFGMILNFYFGSSKGSADKTNVLNDLATTAIQGSASSSSARLVEANTAARRTR